MLHKIAGPQAYPTFNDPKSSGLGIPHFEQAETLQPHSAFGRPGFEKTAIGHFYSDTHKMAAPKRPMLEMCHTEGHDGFADHIMSTPAGFYGELD